jgi:protein-tyrosine phosphatase
VIDLHAHILPGIDDGPESDDDALAMVRLAAADGTTTIACTAHRSARLPTPPARIVQAIADLQPKINAERLGVRLVPGLEIAIDQARVMDDEELRAASLGGAGRWVLIEMPFQGWPLDLPELLTALEVRGFGAVIAHPERAQSVQTSPDRLRDIVGRGALVQITASSLTGDNGPRPQRTAIQLLRAGHAHVIASDMHSPRRRPPGLSDGLAAAAAAARVTPQDLAWMVEDVPLAVIEGRDVRPPRPPGMPPPPAPSRKPREGAPRGGSGPRRPTRR